MLGSKISQISCFKILLLVMLATTACSKKSETQNAQGDVQVQVGLQNADLTYALQVVTLNGISKLDEVAGRFVKFFYSPGATETTVTGSAPHAYFIQASHHFIPSDFISMQMATIYYHIQNLAKFDSQVGADGVNQWPRSIGLETQIIDQSSESGLQKNNAFYNGQTDSMMFVPFTRENLPISVNAGIIAHEHFHSLFYKLLIIPAAKSKKLTTTSASVHAEERSEGRGSQIATADHPLTEQEKVTIYNETFLRAINEGFADFWGWVYTDDPDFIKWSIPEAVESRSLRMMKNSFDLVKAKDDLRQSVENQTSNAQLINLAYEVGTPYARFLKSFSEQQAKAKAISSIESKNIVALVLISFIKDLSSQVQKMKDGETIDPLSLFNYIAQVGAENKLVRLDKDTCGSLIKYINLGQTDSTKMSSCKENDGPQKGQKDSSFVILKP